MQSPRPPLPGTETSTIGVTRTVVLPLETSARKNTRVREAIDEFQAITETAQALIRSFQPSQWGSRKYCSGRIYTKLKRDDYFPVSDRSIYGATMNEAIKKVDEAYESWRENGMEEESPRTFGDGDYVRLHNENVDVVPNDRGWGLRAELLTDVGGTWFHVQGTPYNRQYLERITDDGDDASVGATELHLDPNTGELAAHVSVTWDVEVYEDDDVETVVGVDLNHDPLACTVVVDTSDTPTVEAVEVDPGMVSSATRDDRRTELNDKIADAQERGRYDVADRHRARWSNYTEHVNNVVSRAVVDIALDHEPAMIALEDLTHIRKNQHDTFDHSWPFHELQEQIAYKANEVSLPVETVDPRGTSTTCRKCGHTAESNRDDRDFCCGRCGYEVHSDVNAAINIATRA